jgi:3-oxoacyl-[acyl-carrier-protein] synthase-3
MKAYINAISIYLPEIVVTNEKLAVEFPDWQTLEKNAKMTGIYQRRKVKEDECTSDIAAAASEQLFKEHSIDRRTIDYVLLCTQSPDYFLPTTACIIQDKLGLNTSCGALDIKLGCSGFVYGLSLAKGLIAGKIAKNILLLTGDVVSKLFHSEDKGTLALFGDAATATLISTDGFAEIGNFSLGTDGSGAENLIIKTGGFKHLSPKNDFHYDESGTLVSSDHFYMNGPEVFNFSVEKVPGLLEDTLNKNNLSKQNIQLFIFHQANKFMLDFLRDMLEIEEEKFYCYLSEVGNISSSSIPMAMYHAKKDNLLLGNVLIAGFGVGYSWAGCVLKTNL